MYISKSIKDNPPFVLSCIMMLFMQTQERVFAISELFICLSFLFASKYPLRKFVIKGTDNPFTDLEIRCLVHMNRSVWLSSTFMRVYGVLNACMLLLPDDNYLYHISISITSIYIGLVLNLLYLAFTLLLTWSLFQCRFAGIECVAEDVLNDEKYIKMYRNTNIPII